MERAKVTIKRVSSDRYEVKLDQGSVYSFNKSELFSWLVGVGSVQKDQEFILKFENFS